MIILTLTLIRQHTHIWQHELLERARALRDAKMCNVMEWKDFVPAISDGKLVMTPFCNEIEFEELVKTKSKDEAIAAMGGEEEDDRCATPVAAKTLCIPCAPRRPRRRPPRHRPRRRRPPLHRPRFVRNAAPPGAPAGTTSRKARCPPASPRASRPRRGFCGAAPTEPWLGHTCSRRHRARPTHALLLGVVLT